MSLLSYKHAEETNFIGEKKKTETKNLF